MIFHKNALIDIDEDFTIFHMKYMHFKFDYDSFEIVSSDYECTWEMPFQTGFIDNDE